MLRATPGLLLFGGWQNHERLKTEPRPPILAFELSPKSNTISFKVNLDMIFVFCLFCSLIIPRSAQALLMALCSGFTIDSFWRALGVL